MALQRREQTHGKTKSKEEERERSAQPLRLWSRALRTGAAPDTPRRLRGGGGSGVEGDPASEAEKPPLCLPTRDEDSGGLEAASEGGEALRAARGPPPSLRAGPGGPGPPPRPQRPVQAGGPGAFEAGPPAAAAPGRANAEQMFAPRLPPPPTPGPALNLRPRAAPPHLPRQTKGRSPRPLQTPALGEGAPSPGRPPRPPRRKVSPSTARRAGGAARKVGEQ
ncbi:basic proline-rich protein-like [Ursus americanus]|uniref:basic proline-rich protein-like n=1 Tax=Ursus americanus TaxID=9643 RepID=UPI001E679F8D|nr:basic proline-rich protein-like [Ursus americanus]